MESTTSALCPLLSAAGVPDCSLNPSLISLFLGLAALCALAYLSFVVYDFWPPTGGARKLLTEVAKDSGVFLGQLALVALAWLFFLVPYGRIPFVPSPTAGNFLFWAAPSEYGFVAGALHIVIPTLSLQFVLGLAFGQLTLIWRVVRGDLTARASKVYTALVALVAVVVVWYCIEVSQWPSSAAGWLELALGLSAATLLAQRVIAPYMRASANSFRFQHLIFLIVAGVVVARIWQRHAPAFLESLGLISRRDNPALYPYLLNLLAVIFVVWAIGLLVRPMHVLSSGAYVSSLSGMQYTFVLLLLSAYLLWLGLATPLDQLPFQAPTGVLVGGIVPLLPVYTFFAILGHATASVVGVIFIVAGLSIGLFDFSPRGRPYYTLVILAILGLIFAWEWFGWPLWLLLLSEFYLAYVLPGGIVDVARDIFSKVRLHTPQALRRAQRFGSFVDYALTFALFLVIVSTHDMSSYIIGVISLYFCFALLDSLATRWHGMLQPNITDIVSLTPRRWLFAIPLIAVVAFVGANASPPGWPGFATLTPQVWIDAAIAGATFALFQPLLRLANLSIAFKPPLELTRQPNIISILQNPEGLREVVSEAFRLGVLAGINQAGSDVRRQRQSATVLGANDASDINIVASPALPPALPPAPVPAPSVTQPRHPGDPTLEQPADGRRGPALDSGLVFFCIGAALAYRLIASTVGFTPLLDGTFLAIAATLAGLASSVNAGTNDEVGPASGLIVFVTLIVSIVASLSGLSPTTVIINGWRSEDVHKVMVEFLFCIVLLQMLFLWRTVNYALKDRVRRLNSSDEPGWKEVADRLYTQEENKESLEAYNAALQRAPENDNKSKTEKAYIWASKGNALDSLEQFDEALEAYDEAIRLDPSLAYIWRNKADLLYYDFQRYPEALKAAEQAVNLDGKNARGWMLKGLALRALGHEGEARAAFLTATRKNQNDFLGWYSRGVALYELGQYEDSLQALDAALRFDSNDRDTWAIKAKALRALGRDAEALRAEQRVDGARR